MFIRQWLLTWQGQMLFLAWLGWWPLTRLSWRFMAGHGQWLPARLIWRFWLGLVYSFWLGFVDGSLLKVVEAFWLGLDDGLLARLSWWFLPRLGWWHECWIWCGWLLKRRSGCWIRRNWPQNNKSSGCWLRCRCLENKWWMVKAAGYGCGGSQSCR
jgi:hypothetical protein